MWRISCISGGIGRQLSWATDIEIIAPARKCRRFGRHRQPHTPLMHCSYSQSVFASRHFVA
ncbi:hypothetical protein CO666_26575 [Rhizobium chutanense]|uniref:Uncharacterized protein n=1 Tax=Rhizobium chutanense TaxID=2035448 RepID=A0A2A6J4Z8_9HYPH|nr:hypothetical protein CO666_26575 [Rhizobium chutanense]